ncbi:hypothetical protein AB0G32_35995 [Streptomyces sp. NPDC023723]|uniref:hypothetical protein n=1 Tax=Streptomyces sp. NPDC023723 TaxID=3154323 RepID=UPI0033C9051C
MTKDGNDLNFGQKVVGGLIGAISNTFAVGSAPESAAGGPAGGAEAELLERVRELSADLERLVPSPPVTALGDELAEAEAELVRTGRVSPGRRERLRDALRGAPEVTGVLASAVAVAAAIDQL